MAQDLEIWISMFVESKPRMISKAIPIKKIIIDYQRSNKHSCRHSSCTISSGSHLTMEHDDMAVKITKFSMYYEFSVNDYNKVTYNMCNVSTSCLLSLLSEFCKLLKLLSTQTYERQKTKWSAPSIMGFSYSHLLTRLSTKINKI